MGKPQGGADRIVQHQCRASGDLLRRAILCAVLPHPVPENGPGGGQRSADCQRDHWRPFLHFLWLAVGQGRA
ncbi:hypothetical protein D3C84_1236110 [compost metagenome]